MKEKIAEEKAIEYARKEWPYWTDSKQFKNCKTDYLNGYTDASQQCAELQERIQILESMIEAKDMENKTVEENNDLQINLIIANWMDRQATGNSEVYMAELDLIRGAVKEYASQQCAELKASNEKLQKFKDYVHDRLNKMGVPVDPESPHKAAGCRIGGRLDFVEKRFLELIAHESGRSLQSENESLKKRVEKLTEALEGIEEFASQVVFRQNHEPVFGYNGVEITRSQLIKILEALESPIPLS